MAFRVISGHKVINKSLHNHHHHHQSVLPKRRSFTANPGTNAAVLPKQVFDPFFNELIYAERLSVYFQQNSVIARTADTSMTELPRL